MIPELYIEEWAQNVPWVSSQQVEQDLVIARALVEIYSDETLKQKLAFRGGTALHKLHLKNPKRYSEDLDFVQITAEPIGETLDLLRTQIDPWLGTPKREFGQGIVRLTYRFSAEADNRPLKLKIEINSREHFAGRHIAEIPFTVKSKWFEGRASVASLRIDALLGSKLRALYQRKKGRDLFDLHLSLEELAVAPSAIVKAFYEHLENEKLHISRAEFEENLYRKRKDKIFLSDLLPLLITNQEFNIETAYDSIMNKLIIHLRGKPWQGDLE